MNIHIGTSGWHYPHWRECFYPPSLPKSRWLAYYAHELGAVEVNNSFYRLPSVAAINAWLAETPDDFAFAIKASRLITHRHKLKNCRPQVASFFERVASFGKKLGPILFQLPPRWRCNVPRLREFMVLIPKGFRCAFEFRDASWLNDEVYDVLRKQGAALCIYDLAGFQSPVVVTTDFVYLRFHGPELTPYTGRYHPATLRKWAHRLLEWQREGRDVYCFFDNDQAAYAVRNALQLREKVVAGNH